jgi:endonuclease/exonuclease/phosphatase family metal-dependent hydrolase
VKLLGWNIWNYNRPWWVRRERLVAVIKAEQPDVVALQETRHDFRYVRGRGQGEQLAELTGYHPISRVGQIYVPIPRVDEGLTILILKRPIAAFERRLTMHRREPKDWNQRICLGVTVEVEGGQIDVYDTHFSLSPAARQTNALEVARFVREQSGGRPAILTGDLNAEPASSPIRFLLGQEALGGETGDFVDCWVQANGDAPGYTDPSWDPAVRIDYILGRNLPGPVRAVRLVGAEAQDGIYPSDHLGIVCELDL